jgi:hypothetical protein
MRRVNPLGVLVRGTLAGAAGSWVQNRFFEATASIAPGSPEGAFDPPEKEQREEQATETVARRVSEDLLHQGELSAADKKKGAVAVHYAFGSGWGAVYGVLAESIIGMRSVPGALLFGTGVWIAGDNLILPAFRLAGPPGKYPPRNHVYALAAHWAYGLGVQAAYEALRGPRLFLAGAALLGLAGRRKERLEKARANLRKAARSFAEATRGAAAQVH